MAAASHQRLILCLPQFRVDHAEAAPFSEIVTSMSAPAEDQRCVCQRLRTSMWRRSRLRSAAWTIRRCRFSDWRFIDAGVFAGSGDCCWLRRRRLGKRRRPQRHWGTRLLCLRAHRPRRSWPRRSVNRRRRRRCLGLGLANYPGVQKTLLADWNRNRLKCFKSRQPSGRRWLRCFVFFLSPDLWGGVYPSSYPSPGSQLRRG